MQRPRLIHGLSLLLLALIALAIGGQAPRTTSAVTPMARVFAVYADGIGEQQFTFLEGANAPYGHTTPQPCGPGKVVFEMMSHAQILDIFSGDYSQLNVGGYWPSCSPDGTRIAFTDGDFHPWVMNTDGSGAKELATTSRAYNLSWSKDGTQIAFGTYDATAHIYTGIWIVPSSGGTPVQLTTSGGMPTFSPDGTKIAFEDAEFGLSTVDVATKQVSKLLGGFESLPVREPNWSSTNKLAYSVTYTGTIPPGSTQSEIWIFDLSANTNTRFVTGSQPAWSADGYFMTFARLSTQADGGPGVDISGSFAVEGQVAGATIKRFGNLNVEVRGYVRFKNGTAVGSSTPGSQDYYTQPQLFILAVGAQSTFVNIGLNEDAENEGRETFIAYLTDLEGGHIDGAGKATIVIDETSVDPITIVEPPASTEPVIYTSPAAADLEVALPADDSPVVFTVFRDGAEVFNRTAPATNMIIGAAGVELQATDMAKLCVWATRTIEGCPGMPDSIRVFNRLANYEMRVTYHGQTVTRQFATDLFQDYKFLPLVRG